MYTKRMLTEYAQGLEEPTQTKLLEQIGAIEYNAQANVCTSIQAEQAFNRALLNYLIPSFHTTAITLIKPADVAEIRKLNANR